MQIVTVPPQMPVVPFGAVTHRTVTDDPLIEAFSADRDTEFGCLALAASARAHHGV